MRHIHQREEHWAIGDLQGKGRIFDIGRVAPARIRKIFGLSEVTLVDIAVVRFLISCEDEGIEFVQCPPTCASGWCASAPKEPRLERRMPPDSITQTAQPNQHPVGPIARVSTLADGIIG
ncbi:MAG TPA: hypothetical protein VKB79_13115 [Bryobacteraceae bacterium]|nr:hypothetical protein [Bryobacteraceae bacterium]